MSETNENKLTPQLRFPEFINKGNWKLFDLIDTADKKIRWSFTGGPFGSNLKANDYTENGIRIIQLQNVGDGEFMDDYKIYTSEEKADELLSCNIYSGEIILSKMGDPVGRACIIPKHLKRCLMASDGIRLVIDEKKYSKFFIYSLINSKHVRDAIEKKATGSTRKRIGLDELKKTPLPLPPSTEEQQKIATCLLSLDEVITDENKKLEVLKEHKKGLLQNLFPQESETVPKLRFKEFKDSGEWESVSVEKLVQENILFAPKDGNHGNIHPKSSDYVKRGIPFIMASDLKNGKVDFSKCTYLKKEQADSLQKGFSKSGDVLLTHKGTVGEVALLGDLEFPYIMLTPQVTYYRVKNNSKFSNTYLAAFFNSSSFQKQLFIVSGGGTRAYIGITEQQKLEISFPNSIEEQQKIAYFLSSIDDLINTQSQKVEALKLHKKGLLQGLFPNVNTANE